MGDRNHYERTFSALIAPCTHALRVDEHVRPVLRGLELKNFDYLVNGHDRVWALDLKGRLGSPWISRTDLFSLMSWRRLLGGAIEPALLFTFFARDGALRAGLRAYLHHTPAGVYGFALLRLADAQLLARPRSRRWGTLGFEWKAFCRAALPADQCLPLPVSCPGA